MRETEQFYIGLMSGTSVDGIDAALVFFESSSDLKVLETQFTPYPGGLRSQINDSALNNSSLYKNEDSSLHSTLAAHYAKASNELIAKAGIDKSSVLAIANHGQTVRHEPNARKPFSLQLGDGQIIADKTGIQTITQFRQADIEAGGQGAPLMPAFHNAVFKQASTSFVLNLGGIANLTQLSEQVIGFDTGPGNCLLDQWIEKHQAKRMDQHGHWAQSGTIIQEVLQTLLRDAYIALSYPKSTGTDYFNLDWLETKLPALESYSPKDIQATLLEFTVQSVCTAVRQLNANSGTLYVCGGGAHNKHLMSSLERALVNFSVQKTDSLGVPSDWVEAVGFAWLGYCFINKIPSNLPSVTGARSSVILGQRFTPNSV